MIDSEAKGEHAAWKDKTRKKWINIDASLLNTLLANRIKPNKKIVVYYQVIPVVYS